MASAVVYREEEAEHAAIVKAISGATPISNASVSIKSKEASKGLTISLTENTWYFQMKCFSWIMLPLHWDIMPFICLFFLRKTRIYSHCWVFFVSACECDPAGSAALHCERNTGKCECLPGIGGHKCDRCARGTTGQIPYCEPCGECFDNWDRIIEELKSKSNFVTYICVVF